MASAEKTSGGMANVRLQRGEELVRLDSETIAEFVQLREYRYIDVM
jgi:hypothetical protein